MRRNADLLAGFALQNIPATNRRDESRVGDA